MLSLLPSSHKDILHVINQLLNLFPWMQWRRIHTCAIQPPISNCVEDCNWRANSMNRWAANVVLQPKFLQQVGRVINHSVFEHAHECRSQGWRRRQTWVLNGLAHEKVEVTHVSEMLVAVLGIWKGHEALLGNIPQLISFGYTMCIQYGRKVKSCSNWRLFSYHFRLARKNAWWMIFIFICLNKVQERGNRLKIQPKGGQSKACQAHSKLWCMQWA